MSNETNDLIEILESMIVTGPNDTHRITEAERLAMIAALEQFDAMADRVAQRFTKIAHQMAALTAEIETAGQAVRYQVPAVIKWQLYNAEDPTS